MKNTGITRKLDELGRVVIPREIRENLKLGEKEPLAIYIEGSSIILRKYEQSCVFCGSSKNLVEFKNQHICNKCMKEVQSISREE